MNMTNKSPVSASNCSECLHKDVCKYINAFKDAVSRVEALGYTEDSTATFRVTCKLYIQHHNAQVRKETL